MFSYERRRETKPVFKDGMCDLRNGCCGCFIPYFPYRQFLEQVETSEMLFDLCQILLYTHTRTVRPPYTWVHLLLCQREQKIFRGNNSQCSFENVLTVNWLSTYKFLLAFFFFSSSSFQLHQDSFLLLNMRSFTLSVSCLSECAH